MAAINYSLIGTDDSLKNVNMAYDSILALIDLFYVEKMRQTVTSSSMLTKMMPNQINFSSERLKSYSQMIRSIAGHYYGFEAETIGSELDGCQNTAWAAVNSITEFVDHHTRTRSDSARLANAWFGSGDTLKTLALEMALAE